MGDTENKIPLRSEVAVENTWALEDLYATDDDCKRIQDIVFCILEGDIAVNI